MESDHQRPAPVLHLEGVRLQRGGRVLLDGIDWTIEHGQTWVMLGANGSGKTSLLQVICGYLPATSGRIELLGHRFGRSDWRELRRRIGWVSSSLQSRIPDEETALETVLSGSEAILGWNRGRDHARRPEALGFMDRLGCGQLADSRWAWLSQGERQRVLLARAWFARPDVLFLDEPCAGLDPVAREAFLDWLDQLLAIRELPAASASGGAGPGCRSGGAPPATVLVTHHVEEIVAACSHLLALREGRVLASGSKGDTLTDSVLSDTYGRACRLVGQAGHGRETIGPRIEWAARPVRP